MSTMSAVLSLVPLATRDEVYKGRPQTADR